MLRALVQIAKLLSTIFGILFIPINVYKLTQSYMYAYISSGIICGIIIAVLTWKNIVYINNFRRGYGIYVSRCIITKRKTFISVDIKYSAHIYLSKEMIFLDEPKEYDLVDIYETMPNHSFEKLSYTSKDAKVQSFRKRGDNVYSIVWAPKNVNKINNNTRYRHSFEYESPMPFGDDGFYYSTYFDRETGESNYRIETERPIEWACAFMLPLHLISISEQRLFKYGIEKDSRDCPQPKIESSRRVLTLDIPSPKPGRTYVIFALYENELEAFKRRMQT